MPLTVTLPYTKSLYEIYFTILFIIFYLHDKGNQTIPILPLGYMPSTQENPIWQLNFTAVLTYFYRQQ